MARYARVCAAILLLTVLLAGCATKHPPELPALKTRQERPVVVLIPGFTGTQLRDRDTRKVVWGTGSRLLVPRDGAYGTVHPINASRSATDRLEPFAPVLQVRVLGLFKFEVYGPVLRMMESNGYRPGDLRQPNRGEDFFFFLYDWRYGSVEAAGELARQLEGLRAARGDGQIEVVLICQSNAAMIGRYYLKYGGAPLDQAEAGRASPPPNVRVRKMIFVGTGHGGSLRVLHEMNRGRRYMVAPFGRLITPEAMFTFRPLFESLPAYRQDLFLDGEGRPMGVDLFDPDNWERFGWSVYGRKAQRRLERRERQDLFGDPRDRKEYLRSRLRDALRLHDLLGRDVGGFGATRYYSIQNFRRHTPSRAMLVRKKDRWQTLFLEDKAVRRDPYLRSLAGAPGDGHATLRSQRWLSPQEQAALARLPVYVEGSHFNVILNPAAQRHLLDFLEE